MDTIQWTGNNWPAMWKFLQSGDLKAYALNVDNSLTVETSNWKMTFPVGTWFVLHKNVLWARQGQPIFND